MTTPTVSSHAGPGQQEAVQPACVMPSQHNQEYLELKKLIFWVFGTLVLMTAFSVIVGILTDSLAVGAVAVDGGTSLILHMFNIVSISIILRQNSFSYPYGTGKLENFSGFLYAIIVIPGALLIASSAFKRYTEPVAIINFGLAQGLLILWILRDIWMLYWSLRLCRRFPDHSPMTQSYLINMKLTVTYTLAIFAALLFGFLMSVAGIPELASIIDMFVAVAVSLYMIYCAVGILVRNFKSLIDLPLPEKDQFKILNALVADFDAYQGVGNIYSQLSGSMRLIQIELYFDGTTTAEDIEALRSRIELRLRGDFSKLLFHLIPLVISTGKDN